MDKEMLKGSIDLLLLSMISNRDMYGYEMMKILKETSGEQYEMGEGTLYPALKRLEKKEWIESYWKDTDSGRRKYYHLTDKGTAELEEKRKNWSLVENLVRKVEEGLT
ncbi:PadR family transcriptional regulator [Neobacillus dielmonensis]|uniref:PadR family transcriptional regulator n=1 Tax=Neobacillus dielmonensis TaxID=1347369 RepID=UPI0005AAB47F|nr:PadR family transcriptional regulator [Neobacillus dielmonensis]